MFTRSNRGVVKIQRRCRAVEVSWRLSSGEECPSLGLDFAAAQPRGGNPK